MSNADGDFHGFARSFHGLLRGCARSVAARERIGGGAVYEGTQQDGEHDDTLQEWAAAEPPFFHHHQRKENGRQTARPEPAEEGHARRAQPAAKQRERHRNHAHKGQAQHCVDESGAREGVDGPGDHHRAEEQEDEQGEELPLGLAKLVEGLAHVAAHVTQRETGDEGGDEAVTADELQQLARGLLVDSQLRLAVTGPVAGDEPLEELLKL